MFQLIIFIVLILIVVSIPAYAYGGPGSSIGVILLVLGIIGSLILSILSLFWYPIKRFIRNLRTKNIPKKPTTDDINNSE